MAATVTTKEPFPEGVTREDLQSEIDLRIKAGAIRSWIQEDGGILVIYTEWNVLGQNDS